jgi:hypothetical protein
MLAPFTDDYYRAFCRDLAALCLKYGVSLWAEDTSDA